MKKSLSLSLLILLLFTGCFDKNRNLPVDVSVFEKSMEYGIQWAVISEPYATFRVEGDFSAPVSGYGRQGDIQKVTGRSIAAANGVSTVWYQFEKGWLPETSVILYPYELRANRAAESF
jgi:hypothetical protein